MTKEIETVEKIESLLQELKGLLGASPVKASKVVRKESPETVNFSGLTGDIYGLVQEGFFKSPKSIAEIQRKLRDEGVNKPTTSLMNPLLLLLKKKVLSRSKPVDGKGPYQYQKR